VPSTVLATPDFTKTFILECDPSGRHFFPQNSKLFHEPINISLHALAFLLQIEHKVPFSKKLLDFYHGPCSIFYAQFIQLILVLAIQEFYQLVGLLKLVSHISSCLLNDFGGHFDHFSLLRNYLFQWPNIIDRVSDVGPEHLLYFS